MGASTTGGESSIGPILVDVLLISSQEYNDPLPDFRERVGHCKQLKIKN
jgi:hypothetical protein